VDWDEGEDVLGEEVFGEGVLEEAAVLEVVVKATVLVLLVLGIADGIVKSFFFLLIGLFVMWCNDSNDQARSG
jgi:hypothetical protein